MKFYRVKCASIVWIRIVLATVLVPIAGPCLLAQPLLVPGQNNANFFGNGNQNNAGNANANANPIGRGGAAQADFDTLIDLIVATIEPDTWDDVGGSGSIQGFPGGVYVDAAGVMKRVDSNTQSLLAKRIWRLHPPSSFTDDDLSRRSEFRKISLSRLENAIRALAIREESTTEAMKCLAGLERIDYVVIDKLNNDVILAGPADQWMRADDGRIVSRTTRRPVLQLDDLVVLLRNAVYSNSQFTCSITPTQAGLANFKNYVERTTQRPLKPGTRRKWVEGLQQSLGNQTIEVQGLSAETRVGRVIVEADYHMKLVGIGLEPGTDGVVSYLDSIEIVKGQGPPPLGVLRWWFALRDAPLGVSEDGSTIDLTQPVVQVLSENEMLAKHGRRVHTGQSDVLNKRFANGFTKHFESLAKRYPVYADLENVFELAIVASMIKQERESGHLSWSMSHLLDAEKYRVETARVPREVPSIVNHRVINGKHVVCAVSGGVSFPGQFKTTMYKEGSTTVSVLAEANSNAASTWWWD